MIVSGLIAVLSIIYNHHTPAEILATDITGIFKRLELDRHLSPQTAERPVRDGEAGARDRRPRLNTAARKHRHDDRRDHLPLPAVSPPPAHRAFDD